MPDSLTLPATRQITDNFVANIVSQHDARISPRMLHFRAYRACYRSRFWSERAKLTGVDTRYLDQSEDGQIKVEVSRAYGWIESYVGSLFNDRVRVRFKQDPTGAGEPIKAEITANQFLHKKQIAKRAIADIRQALMYDGAGIKLGLDRSKKKPLDRVWVRNVPWWELVLDYDVVDVGDQRFIGHLYWIPVAEAQKRFHRSDLTGSMRPDALASRKEWSQQGRRSRGRAAVPGDVINDNFVRVFELYNLVDDYCLGESDLVSGRPYAAGTWEAQYRQPDPAIEVEVDEDGNPIECVSPIEKKEEEPRGEPLTMRGRYEVYLPDQSGGSTPVQVFPMPYEKPDGTPLAPLFPLVLVSDPEYPLHGLSSLERVYDQIRELNYSRTFKSNATKRNSRQIVTEKDVFTPESKVAFAQGRDGAMLEFEQNAERSRNAQSIIGSVNLGAIPADNFRYDEEIERDLNQGSNQAPFTRGDPVAGISATQTNVLNQHSQTEIGQLALTRDLWVEQFVELFLRVLIQSIRGAGADEKLTLIHRNKTIVVTAEDLDADFEIEVVPGPTTPIAVQQDRAQFLVIMPVLVKLIAEVRKGDLVAALMLDDMVERYELDDRYRSDNIKRLQDQEEAEKTKTPPGGGPDVKALPGAGSSPPGAGSVSTPDSMATASEPPPGGPQPGPPPGADPNDGRAGILNPPALT